MRLDKVLERKALIDAAELISAGAGAADGDGARVEAGMELKVAFEKGDLGGIDCLEVHFDEPEGDGFAIGVQLVTDGRTPGFSADDQYGISNQRTSDARGGRMILPYENFLILGYPEGWRAVTSARVSIRDGSGVIRRIEGVRRDRASGPRLTDEEFFGECLAGAGTKAARDAAARGEMDAAAAELVRRLRARRKPVHRYATRPSPAAGHSTRAADMIVDHFINGHQLGREIDWRANPEGYLEWMHAFNRHGFLSALSEAYLATGDGKYAAELDYLVSSWVKANPCPVGHNGGGDPAWETLSTACRLAYYWPGVFFATLHAPDFSDRARVTMLESIHAHAEHLVRYRGYDNNWRIAEAQAILTAGILFPEMKRSREWARVGSERLAEEMARQVWPDGVQQEVSPGYHWMCGRAFAAMRDFFSDNGLDLPEGFAGTVESMAEYVMHISRPDGSTPSLNDSGGVRRSWGGPTPAVAYGARVLGRADFRWVLTRGKEGSPPRETFRAFPDAGVFVSRSGWSARANWMLLRAGRTGRAHCHEDKLSFEIAALGDLMLVDPGIASYLNEPWTHYFRSAAAHNVALVDNMAPNQIGRLSKAEKMASSRDDVAWASGEVLDYASGAFYEGYGPPEAGPAGLRHSREMIFIRPDYWVMLDGFTADGDFAAGKRLVELLFHFMPMRVMAEPGRVRTNRLGRPNLDVIPAFPVEPDIRIVCGESDPVQGWIAERGVVPAPVASVRCSGDVPLYLATVMAPYDASGTSGVEVARRDVAGGVDLDIRSARGGRDLVMWRPGGGRGETGETHTDAGLAVLRLGAGGEVISAASVGGSYLRYEGEPLIESDGPVDYAEVVEAGPAG